jgi:hypothetical protein
MTVVEFLGVVASVGLGLLALAWLVLFAPEAAAVGHLQTGVVAFAVASVAAAAAFWYWRRTVERLSLGVAWLCRASVGRLSVRLRERLDPGRVEGGLARYYGRMDVLAADRRTIAAVLGFNFAGWAFSALPLYTSAVALDAEVSVVLALFLVPASGVVTVLPLPGGLGGVELALVGVLAAVGGLALPLAAAVVFLYRICTYWFVLALGAATMAFSATSLADLRVGGDGAK